MRCHQKILNGNLSDFAVVHRLVKVNSMGSGRLPEEFCKRGHVMAETRIVTRRGKSLCGICKKEKNAIWQRDHPELNSKAAKRYRMTHRYTPEQLAQRRIQSRIYYARKVGRPVKKIAKQGTFNRKAYSLSWLLAKRYGLTLEQYDEMNRIQGGRCAICNKVPAGTSHISRRLAVDHDHATGTVRGLLCGTCNTTIGMIEDRPELLDRMRRYLSKHAQLRLVEKLNGIR